MTRFRTRRPPLAASEDLRRWRRLITVAKLVARDPGFPIGDLRLARDRVRGRVMPVGQAVRGSAFDRLARLTDVWDQLTVEDRLARAEDLKTLAVACSAVMAADSPRGGTGRPGRRARADIDG